MADPNCPRCKGFGGYPKCPTCQNVPAQSLAPATGSVGLSDDDLLKILRNGRPNSKEFMAMTYDSWKDGIDLTEPTAFLRRLLTAARDYTPNADEVKRLQSENARLAESKRRDEILTEAMAEIYATIQGRSTQPVERIVNGCREELCSL